MDHLIDKQECLVLFEGQGILPVDKGEQFLWWSLTQIQESSSSPWTYFTKMLRRLKTLKTCS